MDVSGAMASKGAALGGPRPTVEFEALVLARAFEEMLASVEASEAPGTSVWRGILAQAVAAEVAEAGGIGVARRLDAAIGRYAIAAEREA